MGGSDHGPNYLSQFGITATRLCPGRTARSLSNLISSSKKLFSIVELRANGPRLMFPCHSERSGHAGRLLSRTINRSHLRVRKG